MRILVLITIIGFGVLNAQTIQEWAMAQLGPDDSREVTAALELRCGEAAGLEQQHCEEDLRKAFSSGTRDAGDIVRLHCTRFDNRWSDAQDDSDICAQPQEG